MLLYVYTCLKFLILGRCRNIGIWKHISKQESFFSMLLPIPLSLWILFSSHSLLCPASNLTVATSCGQLTKYRKNSLKITMAGQTLVEAGADHPLFCSMAECKNHWASCQSNSGMLYLTRKWIHINLWGQRICFSCELCAPLCPSFRYICSWRKTAFSHLFWNQIHSIKVFCWEVGGWSICFQGRALVNASKLPVDALTFVISS